jgi:histidinol dehydrogenase
VVRRLDDAAALVDALAPEHLQLAMARPERFAARVRHAGAVFLGRFAPEALGDYLAGPNHVLPTSRAARFSSGLGLDAFLKRTTLIGADAAGLARLAPAGIALARAEGLVSHAASMSLRVPRAKG